MNKILQSCIHILSNMVYVYQLPLPRRKNSIFYMKLWSWYMICMDCAVSEKHSRFRISLDSIQIKFYMNPWEHISLKFLSKYIHVHSGNGIWKCRLQNDGHLLAVMYLKERCANGTREKSGIIGDPGSEKYTCETRNMLVPWRTPTEKAPRRVTQINFSNKRNTHWGSYGNKLCVSISNNIPPTLNTHVYIYIYIIYIYIHVHSIKMKVDLAERKNITWSSK